MLARDVNGALQNVSTNCRRRIPDLLHQGRRIYPRASVRQLARTARSGREFFDEQLASLHRGGHDPKKVYNAYKAAVETTGGPTVILAHTIKGYGLGEAGEGRNVTHQQKKLNEQEIIYFRSRFEIPIPEEAAKNASFFRPPADSPEIAYMHERRRQLGGYMPTRSVPPSQIQAPPLET